MPRSSQRLAVTRRRFFGAGVGAAAAVGAGHSLAAAGTFGVPFDSNATGFPMALPDRLPGTTMGVKSKLEFVAYAGFAGAFLAEDPISRGVFNTVGGGLLAVPLDIPAGARLRRIDAYGYRGTSGVQTWNLKKTDITGAVTLITNVSVTATGPLQATFTTGLDIVLGPGERLFVEVTPSSVESTAFGVAYQYTSASTGLVLFGDPATAGDAGNTTPRGPVRVYDSRFGPDGKIGINQERRVSIANEIIGANPGRANVVPAGARAIAYNLTITETETNFGYLTVVPAGESNFGNSSINWDRVGTTIANGLIVGVSSGREVVVRCDGFPTTPVRTHFVIDVTGYFI